MYGGFRFFRLVSYLCSPSPVLFSRSNKYFHLHLGNYEKKKKEKKKAHRFFDVLEYLFFVNVGTFGAIHTYGLLFMR